MIRAALDVLILDKQDLETMSADGTRHTKCVPADILSAVRGMHIFILLKRLLCNSLNIFGQENNGLTQFPNIINPL